MRLIKAGFAIAVLAVLAVAYDAREDIAPVLLRALSSQDSWFRLDPLPISDSPWLFDMGVVDANGDGRLDLYTSNHNYRQAILLADGTGGYRDVVSEWGLDQNPLFPGLEQSMDAPIIDKPGLYVFWVGANLNIVARGVAEMGPVRGTLRVQSRIENVKGGGFDVTAKEEGSPEGDVAERVVSFSADRDAALSLEPKSKGLPITVSLERSPALGSIYVGSQKASPPASTFSLVLQDRHGMAWADYNDDGRLDVFVTRGALGGTLKLFQEDVQRGVKDELFLSTPTGRYRDVAADVGIEKRGCSGRHVKWADFDRDGRLDLYVNCMERGKVEGTYRKQLYRQAADGRFTDVAAEVGLDLPEHQLIDFAWLDADGDGDRDLLTAEDTGFHFYRNEGGHFAREFIYRGAFARADVQGLKGNTDDYWQFDGRLVLGDYDADGDIDVFSPSKKGNAMLVNDSGHFRPVDPKSVGLPGESVAAEWVDYDNDGRLDLHVVPDGLLRQRADRTFETTGMFALPGHKYQAAVINWFDRDNDGRLDLVMALQENPSLWRWWQKPFKTWDDRFAWDVLAYRNVGEGGHWLQLELRGAPGNRLAIGARITVTTPEGRQTREVGSSEGAYMSQGHYRQYFGFGSPSKAARVQIRWPDGHVQELRDVPADSLRVLERGG